MCVLSVKGNFERQSDLSEEESMKRITAVALFIVASTIGVGNALAQEYSLRATMPFNFTVGDKVLLAGTYTILPVRDGLIEIRNQDGKNAILSTADPDSDQYMKNAVLVFNKYGDQYFLREVAGGPRSLNDSLPLSKAEARVRHQENLALNQSQITIPLSEGD